MSSFSFSRAWERNARHHTAAGRAAESIAREMGSDDPLRADPYWRGDDLRPELQTVKNDSGRVIHERMGYEDFPGGVDGAGGDLTYKGRPIVVEGREFDRDAGTHEITFHPEREDGSLDGAYRVKMEKIGPGEWAWGRPRRIR